MRKIPATTLVLVLLVVALAITAGAQTHRANKMENKKNQLKLELQKEPTTNYNIHEDKIRAVPEIEQADPAATIHITDTASATAMRTALRQFLFGTDGPVARLESIASRTADNLKYEPPFSELILPVADVRLMAFRLYDDLLSNVYHLKPHKPAEVPRAVIYHKGHGSDYRARFALLRMFLDKGWDVYEIAMPIVGENRQKHTNIVFNSPHHGPIRLKDHNDLWFVDLKQGSPMRWFVEGAIGVMDYVQKTSPGTRIDMVGLSGGGWTTTLVAAIDNRPKVAVSVAGGWPAYLVNTRMSFQGDYEQVNPELYRIASPLELYVLAAQHRTYLQAFNVSDSCCFAGRSAESYRQAVETSLGKVGPGNYQQFFDETEAAHTIGAPTRDLIIKILQD